MHRAYVQTNNIHERVVPFDKLLTRITMSRAVHIVPTRAPAFFIAWVIFEDDSHTIDDTYFTRVLCFDLLTEIISSKKLINEMIEKINLYFYMQLFLKK